MILYYSVAEEAHRHDPWYSSLEARVERNAKADDSADVTRSNGEDCEEEYLNFCVHVSNGVEGGGDNIMCTRYVHLCWKTPRESDKTPLRCSTHDAWEY